MAVLHITHGKSQIYILMYFENLTNYLKRFCLRNALLVDNNWHIKAKYFRSNVFQNIHMYTVTTAAATTETVQFNSIKTDI